MAYPQLLLDQYKLLTDPEQTLHRNVSSLISAYNSPWDPLTELIQNSVDAINQRARSESPGWRGAIRIVIDSTQNTVTVEDNGKGVKPGNHQAMILPGGSDKINNNSYGHKGLGFTYCAHISDDVVIDAEVADGSKAKWTLKGAFSWLVDPSTTSTQLDTTTATSIKTMTGPGTCVRLTLAIGRYENTIANTAVLENFFKWADDEKLLAFVLRTRTAIGQVGYLFNKTVSTEIDTTVTLVSSSQTFTVPFQYFDLRANPPLNQEPFQKATDYNSNVFQNHHQLNKTHHGIYHVFDTDAASASQPLKVGKVRGGISFAAFVYACGKGNLDTALASYDQRLGSDGDFSYLAVTTDVHLAIDGMPCGVSIDSWNKYGSFEQRYFCIIDAELSFGKVLDPGRKTISRHYVDLLVDKTVEMTKSENTYLANSTFCDLATHLHSPRRPTGGRGVSDYIDRWKLYSAMPSAKMLLQKEPDDELAIYLLFAELAGRGLLPGYRILYVSGAAVYDGAATFEMDLTKPFNLNGSASGTSFGGVGSGLITRAGAIANYKWRDATTGQSHLVMEFKVRAEDLLNELSNRRSEKEMRAINILVCYSIDDVAIKNKRGALTPVNDARREFSGVTHSLSYSGHTADVICLKTLIEKGVSCGIL